jgi:A/G-specific adenine glycosylase
MPNRVGSSTPLDRAKDRRLARSLSRWFDTSARPLPWRTEVRDPYASLVSEIMLQQTQVARVAERFGVFMSRFPTTRALAQAPEGDVLALWSGLGYYRRARNLHAAAGQIIAEFGGEVPRLVPELTRLRGVGRYTAGAIASMVYGEREPVVDGNVARVLLRVEGRPMEHGSPAAMRWAWARAGRLVAEAERPGALNEGLMELGATVCTPRIPRCGECPWRRECIAKAKGMQEQIPRPKARPSRKKVYCAAVVLADTRGGVLLERRADRGMWSGLWQAPTLEQTRPAALEDVSSWIRVARLRAAGSFTQQTTHREVCFRVYRGSLRKGMTRVLQGRSVVARAGLDTLGLGTAQRRAILLGLGERA